MAFGKVKIDEYTGDRGLLRLECWARNGLTDIEIAKNIGISRTTLYEWMKKCPVIADTIKRGRYDAIAEVENALYKNAVGYDVTEEDGKVRHIAGDKTAQIFFLKNRNRRYWKDNPKSEADEREQEARIIKLIKESEDDKASEIKVTIEGGNYAD